ncbi:putative quinol monooxygenase [Mycobacterium sp. smrl_JER01]|uniref:putative quinol monooxygenase n=1 Tax=Mycobacterium sp. smrl_JER01 TaxID=3402633 RepID=UPI003AD542F4
MATKALFVWIEAKPGDGDRVEDFLVWVRLLVEKESGTRTWLAVRLDASRFGILGAFADDAALEAHLAGPIGKELTEKAVLFASPPQIVKLDVLTEKC